MQINFKMINVIEPSSEIEYKKYYSLRYELLRKPWGQPLGSEKDQDENQSFHRMIINKKTDSVLAVGRIQFISQTKAQIRYMGVSTNYQRKGIGSKILLSLEEIAASKGIKAIVLQSREDSIDFYKSNGYRIIKKTFLLFGKIQHWLMQKDIVK